MFVKVFVDEFGNFELTVGVVCDAVLGYVLNLV